MNAANGSAHPSDEYYETLEECLCGARTWLSEVATPTKDERVVIVNEIMFRRRLQPAVVRASVYAYRERTGELYQISRFEDCKPPLPLSP